MGTTVGWAGNLAFRFLLPGYRTALYYYRVASELGLYCCKKLGAFCRSYPEFLMSKATHGRTSKGPRGLRAMACSAPRVPARVRAAIPAPCRHSAPTATDGGPHHPGGYGLWRPCCPPRVIPFPREAKSHHSVGVGRRNRITTARRIPPREIVRGAARRAQSRRRVCRPGAPDARRAAGTFPAGFSP